ncbi:MAG TPA: nucleotide exchange factor GrpE [Baekduia sp.]|nr:nucleotide exchange factor GrpE [Baekduia sp.]
MSEERDTTTPEPHEPEAPEMDPAPEQEAPPAEGGAPEAEREPEAPEDTEARAEDAAAEPAEPDFKDLYLRAAAETENVRKRMRRDVEAAQARGVARLARELLPSLDNLDRALASAEAQEGDAEHHLTKGIRLVQQELLGALTRVGIEPYSPEGEAFDPHQHEAVAQQPVDGAQSGTIVQVYQQGYRYKDEVLRAAKVVVAA